MTPVETANLMEERRYMAAWQSIKGLGARRIRNIISHFGSAQKAWQADGEAVAAAAGLGAQKAGHINTSRNHFDWDEQERLLRSRQVHLVTFQEKAYPELLRRTYNAPAVLFYQGILPQNNKTAALVGARKATPYGLNAAHTLSEQLARQGVFVISGGARGIDTRAHTGALRGGGRTIAVVANGLDRTYPPENRRLFQEICDAGGAVVSEFSFGVEPLARNFPARNRIIAGMARCVIVVEAAARSGALITADFALEEGRDVFAVPGSIFSTMSQGTHALLRNGAIILTCAADVLEEYGWQHVESEKGKSVCTLSDAERKIYEALQESQALPVEQLVIQTGFAASDISCILLNLMLHNLVEEILPGLYVRCPA